MWLAACEVPSWKGCLPATSAQAWEQLPSCSRHYLTHCRGDTRAMKPPRVKMTGRRPDTESSSCHLGEQQAGVSMRRHRSEERGAGRGADTPVRRGEQAGVSMNRHRSEEGKCWSCQRLRGYLAPDRRVPLISSYHSLLAR